MGRPSKASAEPCIAEQCYFRSKLEDIEAYVRSCLVCQQGKTKRRKETGLLELLPIPERPRKNVSMDFISGFLKVREISFIMVVVDKLSKYVVFVSAAKQWSTDLAAQSFLTNKVKLCGLPKEIISYRDPGVMGNFWTALFGILGRN